MTENNYQTPQTQLEPDQQDISILVEPLKAMKPWMIFFAVLGFIGAGFMAIGVLGIFAAAAFSGMPGGTGFAVIGMGVLYALMVGVYIWVSICLWKCGSKISVVVREPNLENIFQALTMQKRFWRLIGILTLVMMGLFVLGMIGAMVLSFTMMM